MALHGGFEGDFELMRLFYPKILHPGQPDTVGTIDKRGALAQSSRMRIRQALAASIIALALGPGLADPARAITPWGFFLFSQALDGLAGRAFGSGGERLPALPPSWPVTRGVAELINESLPLDSGDGFVIVVARAPAPAALEIQATSMGRSAPSSEELDQAWGPGLVTMFCGSEPTLWTRWIAIGGTVGLEVRSSDGSLLRRYGASSADCQALASRG